MLELTRSSSKACRMAEGHMISFIQVMVSLVAPVDGKKGVRFLSCKMFRMTCSKDLLSCLHTLCS